MPSSSTRRYYPVFLSLEGRECLVVGGGAVAAGKARGLLAAGARVTVVSPKLTPDLYNLAIGGDVRHLERGYETPDIRNMALVLTATDDAAVNQRVTADCRSAGTWVNSADDPPNCDFILPSVIRRGRVTLAASTSGGSPSLARRLRQDLETFLDDDVALLADLLTEVRAALQENHTVVDPATWQDAIDARLRALLAQGRYAEAREHLIQRLSRNAPTPAVADRGVR